MIIQAGNKAFLMLSVCLMVLSVSMFSQVQGWILILMLCSFIVRVALFLRLQKHLPSVRSLNLLAILSALLLAYFSFQLGVLLAMINLLVMACALKLMQLRTTRDFYQLAASLFFLTGSGFIFEQSIFFSFIYATVAFALLITLAVFQSPSLQLSRHIKSTLLISAKALPVAILLFVVFPKLGPLWQMPTTKPTESGLSDRVTPGDIANLSQSSELAFRVTFDGPVPQSPERYWRAITLEAFDGKTWYQSSQRIQARRQYQLYQQEFVPQVQGPYFEYEVLSEPTQQRWLFGLDLAVPQGIESNQAIWQGYDYQLISALPLVSSFQYKVRSYPQASLNQSLVSLDRRINLQLPISGNPRTQVWAQSLRQQYPEDEQLIRALMNHFRTQNFSYTLRPDVMPTDPVDRFLFDTRSGFCAHYASAMAYILRLSGIPARMVTGYQGGEMRENNYLSVYQYDAHAWVEAWYDDQGWQRFDPTAMVAPDRISYGLEQAMLAEGSFLADSPFALARLKSIPWLNEFRLALADLDFFWSRWILGFDQQSQQDLFKTLLGTVTPKRLMYLSLSVFLLIALLMAVFFSPIWRQSKQDPVMKLYQRALITLEKAGFARGTGEAPQTFAKTIEAQCSAETAVPFKQLTQALISYQYKENHKDVTKQTLATMKVALSRMKKSLRQ